MLSSCANGGCVPGHTWSGDFRACLLFIPLLQATLHDYKKYQFMHKLNNVKTLKEQRKHILHKYQAIFFEDEALIELLLKSFVSVCINTVCIWVSVTLCPEWHVLGQLVCKTNITNLSTMTCRIYDAYLTVQTMWIWKKHLWCAQYWHCCWSWCLSHML